MSELPNAGSVFDVNGHDWLAEPPLTQDELTEVESQLGIELPDEYRAFLLQVSRGGAGPADGLFPLRRVEGRWRWEEDEADLTELKALSRPFPHTEAFNPADGLPDPPSREDYREALVVSGPARGQMWADDTAGDGGFRPLREPDGRPIGFARWYRRWLEEAEEQTQLHSIKNNS